MPSRRLPDSSLWIHESDALASKFETIVSGEVCSSTRFLIPEPTHGDIAHQPFACQIHNTTLALDVSIRN
jgi:hypothetical protein